MRKPIYNLLLHGIGKPDRNLENGEEKFWITKDSFLRILDFLVNRNDVLLTWDDGNISDASIALPALLERGMKAKFFVSVSNLGKCGYLNSQDTQELIDNGMIVGSHGMYHKNWRCLGNRELADEIWTARDQLENILGYRVTNIAMPYGQYNRRILRMLRKADYEMVYTVDGLGAKAEDWLQPRYCLTKKDSFDTVRSMLNMPSRIFDNTLFALKKWVKRNRWI